MQSVHLFECLDFCIDLWPLMCAHADIGLWKVEGSEEPQREGVQGVATVGEGGGEVGDAPPGGGMLATGQGESSRMEWQGTAGMVERASKLTSQVATLLQLLQVASDGRDSAQVRVRALERKHKEQLAAIGAAEVQRKGLEERMRVLQEAVVASEGEVKTLKKQLTSAEARCVDRVSVASAAAERKVLALAEEHQNKEAALQKTIRELQRTIETKKTIAAQAQQKLHEAEARTSAAESKFTSVADRMQRLESGEAVAKREAAEGRRGREEQRAHAIALQQKLAEAESACLKADERASKARKAAQAKSTEVEDLKIQVSKWESAVGFAQQLHQQALEERGIIEQELETARTSCLDMQVQLDSCADVMVRALDIRRTRLNANALHM